MKIRPKQDPRFKCGGTPKQKRDAETLQRVPRIDRETDNLQNEMFCGSVQ